MSTPTGWRFYLDIRPCERLLHMGKGQTAQGRPALPSSCLHGVKRLPLGVETEWFRSEAPH